jgi:hypothetical protein
MRRVLNSIKKKEQGVVRYSTRILKFGKMGEKSGWTYIEVPLDVAEQLLPDNKKSFRVKGFLDQHEIKGIALIPMGEGNFIMPLNASIRKVLGKRDGAMLSIQIQVDHRKPTINKELLECLKDEPEALKFFLQLPKSHQNYFSKWIESAKTTETKAKRIARTLDALMRKMHYGEMLRAGV